jgi:hypothetical protein
MKYYYSDQLKEDDVGGTRSTHGRYPYEIFVGKPEGKRPLERPNHRWKVILEWILEM